MTKRKMLTINVEFLGGLDAIFGHVREHTVQVEDGSNFRELTQHLVEHLLKDRKDEDVFIEDGSIRPGILVLINDTDWELEGEDEYELQDKDLITFTSTLHGG